MRKIVCATILIMFVGIGCAPSFSDTFIKSTVENASDAQKDADLFKARNPKIQAELKDGTNKQAVISYLNSLEKTLQNRAAVARNISATIVQSQK